MRTLGLVCTLELLMLVTAFGQSAPPTRTDSVEYLRNGGQWNPEVRYAARGAGLDFWVTRTGFVLDQHRYEKCAPEISPVAEMAVPSVESSRSGRAFRRRLGHVVRISVENAALSRPAKESLPGDGLHHFLRGDGSRHATHLVPYGQIEVAGILPGIDLRLLGDGPRPRYDFVVRQGARPEQIVLRFEGHDDLKLTEDGTLRLGTAIGDLTIGRPVAWHELLGDRQFVACGYRRLAPGKFCFEVENHDPRRTLVIDPTVFASVIGGTGNDYYNSVACDALHNTYVCGDSGSTMFPITPGAYSSD